MSDVIQLQSVLANMIRQVEHFSDEYHLGFLHALRQVEKLTSGQVVIDPNRARRVGTDAPWPKGKPRNPPSAQWTAMRDSLRAQSVSLSEIARVCGVHRSSVLRWFLPDGQPRACCPPRVAITRLRRWLRGREVLSAASETQTV